MTSKPYFEWKKDISFWRLLVGSCLLILGLFLILINVGIGLAFLALGLYILRLYYLVDTSRFSFLTTGVPSKLNPIALFVILIFLLLAGWFYFGWYMSPRQIRARCFNREFDRRSKLEQTTNPNSIKNAQEYEQCLLEHGIEL